MNRVPRLDDLIDVETGDAERDRLQHVHDLLLEAGPPPELSPELQAGPTLGATLPRRRRHAVKPRALLLLAAALSVALVFFAGYAVGNGRNSTSSPPPAVSLELTGTSAVPHAQASLDVWHRTGGNWPMTLEVLGLPKLPPHNYYEVYLVRAGKLGGSCGTFRVTRSDRPARVTLNSPYPLRKGDSWVVTRPGPGGVEPGQTVLRPVKT